MFPTSSPLRSARIASLILALAISSPGCGGSGSDPAAASACVTAPPACVHGACVDAAGGAACACTGHWTGAACDRCEGGYHAAGDACVATAVLGLPPTTTSTVAEGGGPATLRVTLTLASGTLAAPASVDVVVTGGTALGGGTDFTFASPTTVTFPPGAASGAYQDVQIAITNDAAVEPDETVALQLVNPGAAVELGVTTHTLTIVDDDCPEGATRLCGMLKAHDAARASVSPAPATPLPAMHWDATVAAAAQAWADQCNFSHNTSGYGQNLYASAGAGYPTPQAVVAAWVSEAAAYDYAANTCSGTCGHYTQVVWRTSIGLGCGMKACSTGSPFGSFPNWYIVVCDYSPPGNYAGQRPY